MKKIIIISFLFHMIIVKSQNVNEKRYSFLNKFTLYYESVSSYFYNNEGQKLTELKLNNLFKNTHVTFLETYVNKFEKRYDKNFDRLILTKEDEDDTLKLIITKKQTNNKVLIQDQISLSGNEIVSVFWKTPNILEGKRVLVVITKDGNYYQSNLIFPNQVMEDFDQYNKGNYVLMQNAKCNGAPNYETFNMKWEKLLSIKDDLIISREYSEEFYPAHNKNEKLNKQILNSLGEYGIYDIDQAHVLLGDVYLFDFDYQYFGVFLNKQLTKNTPVYLNFVTPNGSGYVLQKYAIYNRDIKIKKISIISQESISTELEVTFLVNDKKVSKKVFFNCGAGGYCSGGFDFD